MSQDHPPAIAYGGNRQSGPIEVATAVNAHGGPHGRCDFETETFIAHALRAGGFDASEDGTGRGTPLVTHALDAASAGYATEDGTGRGVPLVAMAYGIRSDAVREGTALTPSADAEGRVRLRDPGLGISADLAPTVDGSAPHAVAFTVSEPANGFAWESDIAHALQAHPQSDTSSIQYGVRQAMSVRRLTPTECERLQGFPDGWTAISWRGKPAADGPRYRALGNAMCVPVVRWILERLERA